MPKPRPVIVDGWVYSSICAAARALGLKRQTVHWWAQRKRKPKRTQYVRLSSEA